jgi:hypothetical protein
VLLFEFVPKAGVGRTVFLGAAGLRTLEIQDNVAEVFRCSAGVQREGKHLETGKTVENKPALGLGSEVFRCFGCLEELMQHGGW